MIRRTLVAATIALVAGCAGGAGAGSSSSATLPQSDARPAAQSTIPGQYFGKFTDTRFRSGKASADLSESGKSVGGEFKFTFAHKPVTAPVALAVAKDDLAGIMTATIKAEACSFTVSATYDPQAYTLDGTYTAKNGCSGESGTFDFKENCYYIDGMRAQSMDAVRPAAGGVKPC
jgi:hypothetical protein